MADEADPPGARASAAQWLPAPERGSALLTRAMVFLSLRLGRRAACLLLYPITGYFFLFAPTARRAAREYLRRALGRAPTGTDRFRQLYAFAVTILDRVYLARDRIDRFTITSEGIGLMQAAFGAGRGAFLLGAHLGSFAMMGAAARLEEPVPGGGGALGPARPADPARAAGPVVAMAMYEHTDSRLARFLRGNDPAAAPEIISLGRVTAMLRIRDCLDEGKFVGMLADRTLAEAPAERVDFLGRPALFPSGPMRAAAALRRSVIFMTGLYRGGNRYHVVFREIADFSQADRRGREAAVRAAIARYARLLEHYCRSDPYNWFNFYDFWHGSGARE